MRVDTQKLRGKMAERGYTITALSKDVGVDRNTLSGYLKNPEKFTYGVLIKIAHILFDSKEEAVSVFFADDLRKTQDKAS